MLKEILEHKRSTLAQLKNSYSKEVLLTLGKSYRKQSFYEAISKEGLSLIAELKKSSPSKGTMRKTFKPLDIAKEYLKFSPKAFSVLTDEKFFGGKNEYLSKVKERFYIPVLRKDFIIDEIQVYESYALGADAILLIAEALEKEVLHNLYKLAKSLEMDVLLEIHGEDQIAKLEGLDVDIIGINNRDLQSFKVNINNCVRVRAELKKTFPKALCVAESGILTSKNYEFIKNQNFDGVLIGEGLIKGDIF
jgi:indole-3-glycerol phosphate synthase